MIIARAPVRISFGGGGTDLAAYYAEHGGFVVSAAIARYSFVVARPTLDGSIRINSADYRVWEHAPAGMTLPVQEPLVLPKAAIEWFGTRGLAPDGVDLFLTAEVPPGTGLGSSSAMSVALFRALAAYTGITLDTCELAELACALEIERLNKPIGKQDQYASAFGGLNAIEFRANGVTVTPLDLPARVAAALNERLLLFSTGQSRDSSSILREQRADSGTKSSVIEGLHRIKALAYDMRAALLVGDLDTFGTLLDQAWQEKRGLSARVSSGAIDTWYAAARKAGALGGKIAGAGGGGFLLLYCPPEHQPAVRAALTEHELRELPFDFDWSGARTIAASNEEYAPQATPVGRV